MSASKISYTRAAVQLLVISGIFPLILFVAAGDWSWGMGWAFIAVLVAATLGSRLLAFRIHPDLLAERTGSFSRKNTEPWDRLLSPLMAFIPMLLLLVAGLDRRYGWSPQLSQGFQILGLGLVALGYAFSTWALLANRFFSSTVRIQTDRGHHVVDSGPYALMRHPGYSGSILSNLALPLALSSLWSFLPAAIVLAVTVLRTWREDRTLQAKLPGYSAYTQRTRYRLLPGVW
jgi:protein-S-isoprenylcysteine O-methyltransferase Ste14